MNSNFKKLMAAVAVFAVAVTYPLALAAKFKAKDKNTIVLTSDNLVRVFGEITDDSVAETIESLRKLDNGSNKPIYMYIYSPGGSIQAGFELIEAANGLKRPVNTITMFSASMAFQLSQAFGDRLILKNGVLMSHRAAGGFQGSFGGKAPSQLDSRYNFWLQRVKELDEQTVARTNGKQTLQSYQEAYQNEAWWTGQQSLDLGYADAIVTVRCGNGLEGTDQHTTSFMGMEVSYETSRCPLITGILNVHLNQLDAKKAPAVLVDEIKSKFTSQFDYVENLK